MIDIKAFREDPQFFETASTNKGYPINAKEIIEIDKKKSDLDLQVQKLREDRNSAAKEKNIEEGKRIKTQLDSLEKELNQVSQELKNKLLLVSNPSKDDVKVGKNEDENDVIRTVGEPTRFDFSPKDHLELGIALDIIDMESAGKVSGARFAYLKNQAAILEFALVQYAMNTLMKEGFQPIVPPVLIKHEVMSGMGYMEHGGEEDMFQSEKDNLVLVGTAEHSIVPMHMGKILDKKELPLRYVGFSTAFRREAGSYGKDTKGILRVHQFDKVEMVSFVAQGDDDKEHELFLGLEEKFFQSLGIPYQVSKMCTGDLGFPTARKYDIEAWMPAQNKYREVTSASTITDFQARRLNIKYRDEDKKEFVNVLNGTAFAIGRTLIAIMENYQTKDGSIMIPEVLQKYTGFDKISK